MTDWSAILTLAVHDKFDREELAGRFGDEVTVSFGPTQQEMTLALDVEAPDVAKATVVAVKQATRMLTRAQVGGTFLAADVMPWADRQVENSTASLPDLVSAPEVGEILGVTRQRVHQLVAENASFPPPLLRLGSGPLWLRSTIEAFNRSWTRKPGRPRLPSMAPNPGVGEATARRRSAAQEVGPLHSPIGSMTAKGVERLARRG